jgi:holo-[acyl-carrier protein] synthase
MIAGVGCDIVEHELTSKLGWDKNPALLSRIFCEQERDQISPNKAIKFLSGRFAAKEAILKSLGTAMEDGISLTEILVLKDDKGKPVVVLNGELKKIAQEMGISAIHLSISHSLSYSIAYAVAERNSITN